MTRARVLALAAQAVNAASTEPEANTAARILARLIHENPDLISDVPDVAQLPGSSAIDPLVGFAVREAVTMAGDLLRDFMRRPPSAPVVNPARARPGPRKASIARRTPKPRP